MMIRGFEAIAAPCAKVLVLGTIPGKQSLATGQYYANPGNAFWFIMDRLFESKADLDYLARRSALVRAKVAVWDVLQSADRDGSADSAIVPGSETPNDFQPFFAHHASVRAVFFNGAAAEKLFRRFVLTTLPERGRGLALKRLPSTSSANTHVTQGRQTRSVEGNQGFIGGRLTTAGGADIPPCGTVKKPGQAMDRTR